MGPAWEYDSQMAILRLQRSADIEQKTAQASIERLDYRSAPEIDVQTIAGS
jgi:hypothetical protein